MDTEIVPLRNFKVKPLKVDYKLTNKYKTKLVKLSKDLNVEDMVPITYDVMFKTMFANTKGKKCLCRLLSLLFSISEEDAMRLFKFSKNELDKESIKDRRNIVDLVGTLGSTKVNVEMNKTDTLKRNFYYLEVISREDVLSGALFSENLTVQINLTDIVFKGDKTVNYFWSRDILNRSLGNKVLINISIPMIRKKLYTFGIDSLNELERYVAMISMDKVKEAKKLAKGDELSMEYIQDAKRAEKSKNFYDDFDYETHLISYYIQDGMRLGRTEGIEEGREKGRTEERKRTIAKMAEIGLPIEKIIECFDLSSEEIEDLKRRLNV